MLIKGKICGNKSKYLNFKEGKRLLFICFLPLYFAVITCPAEMIPYSFGPPYTIVDGSDFARSLNVGGLFQGATIDEAASNWFGLVASADGCAGVNVFKINRTSFSSPDGLTVAKVTAWGYPGCSSTREHVVEVTPLCPKGSTNTGYGCLVDFRIVSADPADNPAPKNGGSYYSIPAVGQTNQTDRFFKLRIVKSQASQLTGVKVELEGDSASRLMEVTKATIIPDYSQGVSSENESATAVTLNVRVSISNPTPSSVQGTPPPANNISYRFVVSGFASNYSESEIVVSDKHALWRGASIFPARYGSRDSGGDDWVSRGTYQWIQTNSALINAVDDVSGEHGRNLKHATHQFGTDIDTFHFYKFPGATTGKDNYNRLRNAVVKAFGTLNADGTINPIPSAAAITAKNQVLSFVTTTRTGLDNLSALATVDRMYYMLGSKNSGLQTGWAQTLIEKGTVVLTANSVSRTLSLGLTSWSNKKVDFNPDHHSHLHITLNRKAIGDQ